MGPKLFPPAFMASPQRTSTRLVPGQGTLGEAPVSSPLHSHPTGLGPPHPHSKVTCGKSGQRRLKGTVGEFLLAKLGINRVFQSLKAMGWAEEVRRVERRGSLGE